MKNNLFFSLIRSPLGDKGAEMGRQKDSDVTAKEPKQITK